MKLYITRTSPYARMVRMVILEKGLRDRVEIILAQTRSEGSPYYRINPSGRVPYLVLDDGVGLEESQVICAYLDRLDGRPAFDLPALDLPLGNEAWEARRLEARARSMLDGLTVWNRELARPPDERSPTIIRHEIARAARMADLWEKEIDHPWLLGEINMAQMTLACALGFETSLTELRWRPGHPRLVAWFEHFAQRPSFTLTDPSDR